MKNFIKYLKENNVEFKANGKKTTVLGGDVDLRSLTSMPDNVEFNNGGYVYLNSLTSMPDNVEFNNGEHVYLNSLTSMPDNVEFNNGGGVDLGSLTSMPDNVEFNNGGDVDLKDNRIHIGKDYITRFQISVIKGKVILYKRVSKDFKTQEGTDHETTWTIGTTLTHPAWNPTEQECGAGKFHACARPHRCDVFRSTKGDKYIAIQIKVEDLFEWKSPSYPQKIGFRKGKVLKTVKRLIK